MCTPPPSTGSHLSILPHLPLCRNPAQRVGNGRRRQGVAFLSPPHTPGTAPALQGGTGTQPPTPRHVLQVGGCLQSGTKMCRGKQGGGGEGRGNKSWPPIHGWNLLCRWRGSQHTGGKEEGENLTAGSQRSG